MIYRKNKKSKMGPERSMYEYKVRCGLKKSAFCPIWQGLRHLALVLSFIFILPIASYAADNLDQLLQSYAVNTKTLAGLSAVLVPDIQAAHNADEAAVRIETYATVYHTVAQTFQSVMPAFLESKKADAVSALEMQSMLESSQRMSEVGKTLTSESDAFDEALKPYENDARVAAAVNTFSNEGHALQAMAEQYK
jgi:hypothetical protein